MKKTFLLLTACLLTTATWAQTWQIGSPNAGDMTASLNKGTLTIQGSGQMQNFNVNTGMAPWLSQKDEVKTLIVEEGVTSIGQLAFQNHTALTDMLLPSSLTTIGGNAFQGCTALAEIIIENPVPPTAPGQYPFTGVTTRYCVLRVPEGSEAAYRANSMWNAFNIVEKGTVPLLCGGATNVEKFGSKFGLEDIFTWYICENTTLVIRGEGDLPAFVYPREDRDANLFSPWHSIVERTIKGIVIEEGIKSLSAGVAHFSISLVEISLPNSLESIEQAFWNCWALREVVLPEGLKTIQNDFFNCDALTKVTIPSTVTLVGRYTFGKCPALQSIIIKNPIPPTLDESAFMELDKRRCTLTVPKGSKAAYEAAEGWNIFNIVEGDFSSINHIESAEKTLVGYYNVMGQKLSEEPESGLYILLYDDGTTEKRVKK